MYVLIACKDVKVKSIIEYYTYSVNYCEVVGYPVHAFYRNQCNLIEY